MSTNERESLETDTSFVFADCVELCAWIFVVSGVVITFVSIFLFIRDEIAQQHFSPGTPRGNYTEQLVASLQRNANPCEDFYSFVCDGWVRDHITGPPSLVDELEVQVFRDAAQALNAASWSKASSIGKASAMFRSCRTLVSKKERNTEGVESFLKSRIAFPAVQPMPTSSIVHLLVELSLSFGIHILFAVKLFADHDSDARPTVSLAPNRELTEWMQLMTNLNARGKLREFMVANLQVLSIFREEDALLESIARGDTSLIPQVTGGYDINAWRYEELPSSAVPGVPAQAWLDAVNNQTFPYFTVGPNDYVKMEGSDAFRGIARLLVQTNRDEPGVLPTFIGWHLVRQLARRASYSAAEALFKSRDDHYDACFKDTTDLMPLAASRPFTLNSPKASTKSLAAELVQDLRDEFAKTFRGTPWLDRRTRSKAIVKVESVNEVLVEPDVALNGTALDEYYANFTSYGNYFDTWLHASRAATQRKMASLAEGETFVSYEFLPIQVNAFYERQFNAMFLPSGIIRAPYIDDISPASMNLAGLGAVIGHEMMHGFDDKGKDRDREGKPKDWWAPSVKDEYGKRLQCLQEVYRSDPAFLTENVADSASLPTVYSAFLKRSNSSPPTPHILRGFSQEVIFFLSYCFKLCSRTVSAALGYPTDRDRCNVALQNFPQFSATFRCQLWNKMNPPKRCSLWGPD